MPLIGGFREPGSATSNIETGQPHKTDIVYLRRTGTDGLGLLIGAPIIVAGCQLPDAYRAVDLETRTEVSTANRYRAEIGLNGQPVPISGVTLEHSLAERDYLVIEDPANPLQELRIASGGPAEQPTHYTTAGRFGLARHRVKISRNGMPIFVYLSRQIGEETTSLLVPAEGYARAWRTRGPVDTGATSKEVRSADLLGLFVTAMAEQKEMYELGVAFKAAIL